VHGIAGRLCGVDESGRRGKGHGRSGGLGRRIIVGPASPSLRVSHESNLLLFPDI
jgi:hypothetical protein